ncbi:hypothetical protein H5410_040297 [Solanum commersonii]|uniref:DUF7746 domain-containing protein n=1 Tax=Solanum commersonii TaxID=4109 RepID=A0A9J5XQJ3_SOLCO|nr:hypothetical protein H5410_040297 [Solanum commersonii]
MLMYNTICKTNKNSDKTIADMITTGFTGQLKGRPRRVRDLNATCTKPICIKRVRPAPSLANGFLVVMIDRSIIHLVLQPFRNLLTERRKLISFPTTINDLKQEINNLKEDIRHLKEKNVIIEV